MRGNLATNSRDRASPIVGDIKPSNSRITAIVIAAAAAVLRSDRAVKPASIPAGSKEYARANGAITTNRYQLTGRAIHSNFGAAPAHRYWTGCSINRVAANANRSRPQENPARGR